VSERVLKALETVSYKTEDFIIKETGKSENEFSFVLVLNSIYKGFGYLKKSEVEYSTQDYLSATTLYKDNRDVHRILQGYLKKNKEALVSVSPIFEGGLFG